MADQGEIFTRFMAGNDTRGVRASARRAARSEANSKFGTGQMQAPSRSGPPADANTAANVNTDYRTNR